MKRLWVRLSLMIGGVLFLVFFIQFVAITLDQVAAIPNEDVFELPLPPNEITRRLFVFMGLSVVVGLAGGVVIGRVVSAPLSDLARAAQSVGKGELEVRVPARGSQEMVELADAFNKMASDLKQAEILRNNLMADVSHELRTPLAVLDSNLRSVLDHVCTLDEAEIASLYGQTHHLIRLVNDLRELALAEAGKLPIEKRPTDLRALVVEVLQALEPLATEGNIFVLDQVGALPCVDADTIRIRQTLFNLLTNALRHTASGGQITVLGVTNATSITLSVQDTGEGLDADQLASVFNRFYRADKSRNRETGGTGLGLAIVKAIVEAHGGAVAAFSAGKGMGSCFSFTLPRASV